MKLITDYPRKLNLQDQFHLRRLKSELITSAMWINRKSVKKVSVVIKYRKTLSKTGRVYKRFYYSENQLIEIYSIILKNLLPHIEIINWQVEELLPDHHPYVIVDFKKS